MPLFEYRCNECGKTFEELVTGDRDKKIPCPECGASSTEKLMSAIGGISMGRSGSAPACESGCPGASHCASAGGGGCCQAG